MLHGLVLSPEGGSGWESRSQQPVRGFCGSMLPSTVPWGSVSVKGWKVPKPQFTMHMMALRVEAGADSFPCPSRQAAQQHHRDLLTLVLCSDAHHAYAGVCLWLWLWCPAVGQTPVYVLHMAMLEPFCACVPD